MPAQVIKIIGARQHNLKNLSVEIPREKLVVITGLSGSGKSSLAFDTLYAEGQRRYVESLSAYARQFLDKMEKPDVDFIEGLSPAIAIEQRSAGANPRSTIATTTEIYDYLRVLFSAVGQPHDPVTGKALVRQTPQQIVDQILAYPPETKIVALAPIVENERGEFRDVIEKLRREGFVRARIDGEILELGRPEPIRLKKTESHTIEAVVDRLIVRDGVRVRLADSVDTALKWGGNRVVVLRDVEGAVPSAPKTVDATARVPPKKWEPQRYSTDYGNADSGFTLGELTPKHFSFNSHLGACPACHGLGTQLVVDPELMISEPEKSIAEGVITPWRRGPKRMQVYYKKLQGALVKYFRIDEEAPFAELPENFKRALYFGTGETPIEMKFGSNGEKIAKPFEGLVPQMQRLYEETESEFTRNRIRSFMTREPCKVCRGARLRPEILAVTVKSSVIPSEVEGSRGSKLQGNAAGSLGPSRTGGIARDDGCELNIHQFTELTVQAAAEFISQIGLSTQQKQIASEVVREIESRLQFLLEVGLGYLTLDRESGTLSGGEAQRIRLATQIGSGLAGVLYVLDEPSIGLHQRDNIRLLGTLNRLRDLGNSVIVVEHDEETIRAADHIIDLGPGAGPRGGEIVAQGTLGEILGAKHSITAEYLSGRARIAVPKHRVAPRSNDHGSNRPPLQEGWLTILGASENNLKNVSASFPLGCFICVTGVSGSGKSTLVDDILRRALFRHFYNAKERPGAFRGLRGVDQIDKAIVIDQSAIGRTPRSNPITYSGAFTPIRELFAQLPAARVRGYDAGRFSFNVKGGRCENCEGGGLIKIEMHFLPVLMKLRDAGNTLVVIEHNLEVIKCADWLIDLGPEGGERGGRIIAAGPPEKVAQVAGSYTGEFLRPLLR